MNLTGRFRAMQLRVKSRRYPVAVRLIAGLAGLVVLGTALLMLPGVGASQPLGFGEALFTAVSALSVTGLSTFAPSTGLTILGQIILLGLVQLGGVGFMVVAVVVLQLIGRRVSLNDRLALRDSLGLVAPGAILQLTRRILVGVLIIEGIGAFLLWLNWRTLLGDGPGLLYAIFHAVSAFCNAGFELFTGRPGFEPGLPSDAYTLSVVGVLIVLGGLGIPVLSDVLNWPRQRRLSLHTRITLWLVLVLTGAGALGIFLGEGRPGNILQGEPWIRRLGLATFQAVSARTAGFTAVESFTQMAPSSQLVLIMLMFIGCAPASMGGGITTGTLATLTLALWSYARGLPSAQVGRRTISRGKIIRAGAVLTVSLFVVMAATLLILLTHPATLDEALFEVVSAFATCGLSLGLTGQLNPFGQIVIMIVMFWGRLGALTIVAALAQQRPAPLVAYPKEDILIG